MSNDKFEEWIENKKHIRGRLHPIVQEYTKETTIGVFCLNPKSVIEKPHERIFDILSSRGYTRLYVLYFFSRIGDFSELLNMPTRELIHERTNELIKEIIPDVNKVFFAHGTPSSQKAEQIINERVEEVKQLIFQIKPKEAILKFGELNRNGYPKRLNDIQSNDIESEI
jgi:hypothetical protein